MDANYYLQEKERLSWALNGEENLENAASAIMAALKEFKLDVMPRVAADVFMYAMETQHLKSFNLRDRRLKGK